MAISNASNFVYSPTGKYLFGRSYALAIGAPYQTSALQYSNVPSTGSGGRILPPSPLRVRFDIEKNTFGSPNKAKFEIFNLSQQSRQAIKIGYILQLQAGYSGLLDTVFVGNVSPTGGVKSERKEADIITTIECLDGGSAILMPTLDKTYPPGSTLSQIISDIATAMRTPTSSNPLGSNAGVALGVPNVVYGRGITISGTCKDTLSKLLTPQGLRWSVQNGNLTIVPAKGYNGNSAIVLSTQTGLIGTPSQGTQFVDFTSLLNPQLVPEALVQLISENTALNGFYKIVNAHFEGDTHDNRWQVTCQGTKMPNIQQALASSNALNPSKS